jgi:hypothetical protein
MDRCASDAAQRARHHDRLSALHRCGMTHQLISRQCDQGKRGRVFQIHSVGQMGYYGTLDRDQLGVRRGGKCNDPIPRFEISDARAHRTHCPTYIPAQYRRQL